MKYAWIEKHRQTYSTTLMCELLSVSRSGLNAARERKPSRRVLDDEKLLEQIRDAQGKHRGRYGRRRMTAEVMPGTGPPTARSTTSASHGSCKSMGCRATSGGDAEC